MPATPPFPAASPSPPPPPAERLPSGRHRLTRETVVASQRGRLLDAMAQVVAERGYAAATVAEVVERAGVSRRTFYEQFSDKESCFLAAYDVGVEVLRGHIAAAVEPLEPGDWRGRARAGITTYLRVLSEEPAFAWSFTVEVLGAGPAALERRAGVVTLFAGLWRAVHEMGRSVEPWLPQLPRELFVTLSGGLEELARECLRSKGAAALPELAEPALAVALAILGGAREPPTSPTA